PGAVAHPLRQPVAELEAALVSKRDGIPAARFQDHQLVGWPAVHKVARSARTAFLLDCANDGEATVGSSGLPCHRRDGGGQRALGVDGAATENALALAAHGHETRNRVHVPEEQYLTRSAAPEGDDVANLVALRGKPHGTQSGNEPLAELALLRRGTGDRHH